MIRREMVEELRRESFDLFERFESAEPESESEPDDWDGLVNWGLELAHQRSVPGAWRAPPDPQPPKRQPSTVASVQRDWEAVIDARADARLVAAFSRGGTLYEMLVDGIGDALGEVRERHRRALKALRRELDAARAEIKELREMTATRSVTWHIDPTRYRVFPFVNGKMGPQLNLRPLFEAYHIETSYRDRD